MSDTQLPDKLLVVALDAIDKGAGMTASTRSCMGLLKVCLDHKSTIADVLQATARAALDCGHHLGNDKQLSAKFCGFFTVYHDAVKRNHPDSLVHQRTALYGWDLTIWVIAGDLKAVNHKVNVLLRETAKAVKEAENNER